MKRLRLLFISLAVLFIATVVLAGQAGYDYYFPCYFTGCSKPQHNIWGSTNRPGTVPAYSNTYGVVVSSGGPTTYDKLVLETRIWDKVNSACPLKKLVEEVGTCTNCNRAPQPSHPLYSSTYGGSMEVFQPSGINTIVVSKHKLVHAGVVNRLGASPSPFFTEINNNVSTQDVYKGVYFGCSIP